MSKTKPDTCRAVPKRGRVTFSKRLSAVRCEGAENDDLELLTVDELQRALQAADNETLASIRVAADSSDAGIIARHKETGSFTVVSDAEILALQEQGNASLADILGQQSANDGDESPEFSLLSTQVFRTLMDGDN